MHTFVHNYLIQQSVHMTWSNFFHLSILTSLHARERFLRSCQMQANSGKTVDSRIPLESHLAVVTYAKDIHFILLRLKNMVSLEGVIRCINTSQHEGKISLISSLMSLPLCGRCSPQVSLLSFSLRALAHFLYVPSSSLLFHHAKFLPVFTPSPTCRTPQHSSTNRISLRRWRRGRVMEAHASTSWILLGKMLRFQIDA